MMSLPKDDDLYCLTCYISKFKPPQISEHNVVARGNEYIHFGITPNLACLYGDKIKDILRIKMKISDNQNVPEKIGAFDKSYWGWFDFRANKFTFIYLGYHILNMVFPAGIKISEEVGKGKAYRLEFDEIVKHELTEKIKS